MYCILHVNLWNLCTYYRLAGIVRSVCSVCDNDVLLYVNVVYCWWQGAVVSMCQCNDQKRLPWQVAWHCREHCHKPGVRQAQHVAGISHLSLPTCQKLRVSLAFIFSISIRVTFVSSQITYVILAIAERPAEFPFPHAPTNPHDNFIPDPRPYWLEITNQTQ